MIHEIEKSGDTAVLILKGDLTVEGVKELKDTILGCMAEVNQVSVRLEELGNVDLSCLQVLCAAHRTFDSENKVFSISTESMGKIRHAANRAGFSQARMCGLTPAVPCLWGGEK